MSSKCFERYIQARPQYYKQRMSSKYFERYIQARPQYYKQRMSSKCFKRYVYVCNVYIQTRPQYYKYGMSSKCFEKYIKYLIYVLSSYQWTHHTGSICAAHAIQYMVNTCRRVSQHPLLPHWPHLFLQDRINRQCRSHGNLIS